MDADHPFAPAAELEKLYAEDAERRTKAGKKDLREALPQGKASDQAAKVVGISGRIVQEAKRVVARAPAAVVEAIRAGTPKVWLRPKLRREVGLRSTFEHIADACLSPRAERRYHCPSMAEPTLKDVLDAIAKMDARLDAKIDAHRAETAAHRAETRQGFAEVEKYVAQHVVSHRSLEERVEKLEARLPAARPSTRAPRRR